MFFDLFLVVCIDVIEVSDYDPIADIHCSILDVDYRCDRHEAFMVLERRYLEYHVSLVQFRHTYCLSRMFDPW